MSALLVPVVGACESLVSGPSSLEVSGRDWRNHSIRSPVAGTAPTSFSLYPHQNIKRSLRKYLPVTFDLPRSMPPVWRPLNFFRRLLRAVRALAGLNVVLFNPVFAIQPYRLHANEGLEFRRRWQFQ